MKLKDILKRPVVKPGIRNSGCQILCDIAEKLTVKLAPTRTRPERLLHTRCLHGVLAAAQVSKHTQLRLGTIAWLKTAATTVCGCLLAQAHRTRAANLARLVIPRLTYNSKLLHGEQHA